MSQLNIKIISQRDDDTFNANHLHIKIKGKSINHVIINTIRRIMIEEVPCYAFDINSINIKSNTSVYNNDYIRNRIENLPIPNIENNFDLNEYDNIRHQLFSNIQIEENKNSNNYHLLNMYVKEKNTSDLITNITSEHCEFYIKGKKIKSIYKNPILICKLKPKEEIELSAIIEKNIALNHSKYAIVSICCFEKISENEYILKFENRNQIKNKEVLIRTIKIIIHKLKNLLNKIQKKTFSSDNHGKIIFKNENHTLGNLVGRGLQDNNCIDFAAYKLEHLLIDELTIEYITNGSKTINEILNKTINKYIKLYEEFERKILSLKIK